jgi:hypothetical protein
MLMCRGHVFGQSGMSPLPKMALMNSNTLGVDVHFHLLAVVYDFCLLTDIPVRHTVKMFVLTQFNMIVFLNFGCGCPPHYKGFGR